MHIRGHFHSGSLLAKIMYRYTERHPATNTHPQCICRLYAARVITVINLKKCLGMEDDGRKVCLLSRILINLMWHSLFQILLRWWNSNPFPRSYEQPLYRLLVQAMHPYTILQCPSNPVQKSFLRNLILPTRKWPY